MPGFEHSSLEHIQQIRNDLRDRYREGFPILKELLQNADDAEASRLHLGWFSGFPHIAHPLLKGPALFVVNDGKFKAVDQDGIRHIGISAKASDRAAIGKFGLGLKSVFHLCEAFFYFWSEADTFEILNPWHGTTPPIHENWELDDASFASETRQAIVECLESLGLHDFRDWLCLWIPLRQKQHRGEVPAIVEKYPGNDERERQESTLGLNPAHEISKALPMLRHLKSVSVWSLGTDGSSEMLFQVNLEDGATRCRYRGHEQGISTTTHTEQLLLKGTVNQCLYAGFEQTLILPIFDQLRRSEYWPTVFGIDSTGTEQPNEEKADPHCAAYFMETPAEGRGSLRIQQAVFLPVGDPKETKCEGESDFTLMLHGYFFPNAGRTDIEIPKDEIADAVNNETEVRLSWNYELFVRGALPLIIPALNRFVKDGNLSGEKVLKLTKALENSDTFGQRRKYVCRDTQWVRRLTASGTEWEQLDGPNAEILEIPPPPESAPNRPVEVFPILRELASEQAITFCDAPRLTTQKAASKWSPELLVQMLHAVPVETVFENRGMLEYFVDFLKDCAQDTRFDVANALQELMRKALNAIPLGKLRKNRSRIKNFLELLPANSCFSIPDGISEEVFLELVQPRLRVILVPEDLIPEVPHQLLVESLCNEDAVKILRFVSTLGENRDLERPERTLVQQVIAASHWDGIRAECDSFKIFTAYDGRKKRDVSISFGQLREQKRKGVLFAQPFSQAGHLQKALDSIPVILIDKSTREILGWENDIRLCDERACLQVLESKPALNSPEKRGNLLSALLSQVGSLPESNHAVRYLIHAYPSDDNLPLFIEASVGQELWSRIASQILRLKNEQWRAMPGALGETIPPQYWNPLGIHVLDSGAITQLIREVGSERVSCTGFSVGDRQQILQHIDDLEILRGLKIYDDVDGNLVQINFECTFWEGEFPCENIPRENITILRPLPEYLHWKQSRILDRFFTANNAVRVLLNEEHPHQHWEQILKALYHLNTVPSDLRQELKDATWLPIGAGRSPQDVIYVKDMEDEVTRIVAQFGDSFVDVSMLPERFLTHPGYKKTVRDIFPKRDDALEMLGEMMARAKKYRIGYIDTQGMNLEVFLSTFENALPQLMPSHSILQRVYDVFGEEVCRERLLPKLCQNISTARIVNILDFLCERHTAAPRNSKSKILDIFNRYLTAATNTSKFREILTQVQLLSRGGNWKSPAKLCLDAEGIQGNDLLDTKQSSIVRDRVQSSVVVGQQQSGASQPPEGNEEQQFEESAARLEQYFNAWEGAVPNEVIGGFLSLLGNHPGLLELSGKYLDLGNRTVDGFREPLNRDWKVTPNASAVGADEDINATMKKQRFLVEVVESQTINVTNLLGAPFHARIELNRFDSLFVGSTNEQFRFQTGMSFRVNRIKLRSIQLDEFTRPKLCNLIKDSAALLLDKVYKQAPQNLDEVFNDLAQSEQLDIRIAQNLLLESAFFYVQQLEMRDMDSNLSTILQNWDEARRRLAEGEHTDNTGQANEAAGELQQKQQELQKLIQSDESAQHSLLTAVRRKVKDHYQYKPQSVPFEIFQNADDAVVELLELRGNSHSDNRDETRFVIKQEDDRIAFIHWGRPINKFRSAHIDYAQSKKFKRDLEKMLILSNSDKTESPGNVTGKFGLGFKSVFLVTSKPRVASGQLGFEAVGGFFPKQLTGNCLKELQNQIPVCQNDGKEGTIISIQAEECSVQKCLKEFRDVVHLIPVFAKRIRRCDWITDGQTESWEWNGKPLTQSNRVCVGKLQPRSDGRQRHQAIVVLHTSQGDLLVELNSRGVVELEESVPTVWVTVPTTECLGLGFIVNGRFDLDVGRAQLAQDSRKNRDVADSIGREVGESLIELFDEASRDWANFCANLDLTVSTDRYEFWHSLWRLFSKVTPERSTNDGDASQLLRQILWKDSEHGMGRLFQQRSAIPSGLWGDYKTLTRLDQIKFKTVGVLDTDESVFCQASQWPPFQQDILREHVVSHGGIASVLTSMLPNENLNMQEVTLCSLLQRELGENHYVDASQASRLGSLITRNFLNNLDRGNWEQRSEYRELTGFLRNLRFQAYDGAFHTAQDLLIKDEGADNRDEPLRAAFAPEDRRLNDDYIGSAIEFFKACRSELNAPPQSMAEWAVAASSSQTRHSVLEYILNGQLRREVASEIIQEGIEETWLRDLAESPLLTDQFNLWERSKILVELRLFDERIIIPPIPDPVPLVTLEPSAVLENIHAWWTREAGDYIRKYKESVYGGFRLQLSDLPDWEDSQTRENWLTLFMLGALHTMGRAKPEQHRSFIKLWRQNRWLQIVADPQKNLQSWVEIVVDFLDQPGETIQFFNWMRQFVSIVQFAYWLEDYGEAFSQIDRLNHDFPLTAITRLRYSSLSQSSDIRPPSIDRTLGIGACFVVRELMRLGVLSSVHAHEHCYTPVSRVRKLLESIGCPDLDSNAHQRWEQSRTIYQFLREHLEKRATFDKAYDIPFLIIADDKRLQNEFFGTCVLQDEDDEETYE